MDWKNIITQAKARHRLTQPQLAEIVGCTQPSISALERGVTQDPRFSIGQKLLELATSRPRRSSKRHTAAVEA